MLWKCWLYMPTNLENSAVATGLEKVSFHSNTKERQCQRMLKLLHNCSHLTLACKVKLNILQTRLSKPGFNSTWTVKFQIFKLDFWKGRGTREQLPTSIGSSKKWESSRKTSISASLTMPKPLTMSITTNCEKFLKRWEYQITLSASWEICM